MGNTLELLLYCTLGYCLEVKCSVYACIKEIEVNKGKEETIYAKYVGIPAVQMWFKCMQT